MAGPACDYEDMPSHPNAPKRISRGGGKKKGKKKKGRGKRMAKKY